MEADDEAPTLQLGSWEPRAMPAAGGLEHLSGADQCAGSATRSRDGEPDDLLDLLQASPPSGAPGCLGVDSIRSGFESASTSAPAFPAQPGALASFPKLPGDREAPAFCRSATLPLDFADSGSSLPPPAEPAEEPAAMLATVNSATAPDILLTAPGTVFGRAGGGAAAVVLGDDRVSAQQFVVHRRPGPVSAAGRVRWLYELEDRSRNGTLVNKRPIRGSTVQLSDRDLVEVLPAAKVGQAAAIGFLFHAPTLPVDCDEAALEQPSKKPRISDGDLFVDEKKASGSGSTGDLLEGALCTICQEALHRATSVQPCLHSFCSTCLGGWLRRGSWGAPAKCPVCRGGVASVSRNHTLDSLIEALLKANPGRQRPADAIAELDADDQLHASGYDLARFRAKGAGKGAAPAIAAHLDASDDEEEEGSGSEESSGSGSGRGAVAAARPPRAPCFNCSAPSWRSLDEAAHWYDTAAARAPGFDVSVFLREALSDNDFERRVLEDWLAARGLSLAQALGGLLAEPNPAGLPPVTAPGGGMPSPTGVAWPSLRGCRTCTLNVLRALVYSLRERIPPAELPAYVAPDRGNCWYGRGCRTQRHKPEHAERLNHICAQTRFA